MLLYMHVRFGVANRYASFVLGTHATFLPCSFVSEALDSLRASMFAILQVLGRPFIADDTVFSMDSFWKKHAWRPE
jgi:hypothetical protein